MATIIVGNSYSQVTNLAKDYWPALRKALSYQSEPSAAYYSGFGPRTFYLIDKRGNFPSGLLNRVVRFFEKSKNSCIVVDKRVNPLGNTVLNTTTHVTSGLHRAQIDAAWDAVAHERGIISMPTGTGKSLVIAQIAHFYNTKTLIVVPNLELKAQLTATIAKYLPERNNIIVENIDSPALNNITDCNLLLIDEAHHSAAKTYQNLNKKAWQGIYHRFFLTATPFRNRENEQLLFESIAGSIIYELPYMDAIKNSYIVPVDAYYLDVKKHWTPAFTWADVYADLVVHNAERNQLIANFLEALQENSKSALCLVKEIKHGAILSKFSGIPFANGQDEESRKYIQQFNAGEIKQLIGTTGIIGEGVDTKPCEYVIIAGLGKAKSAFMQQVGRAVRKYEGKESAKVIIFNDRSHKFTQRHFSAQKKILKEEYGVEVQKLDF